MVFVYPECIRLSLRYIATGVCYISKLEMFTHCEQTHMCDNCACMCMRLCVRQNFFLKNSHVQWGASTTHVSRRGGYFVQDTGLVFWSNFISPFIVLCHYTCVWQLYDNCTTIVRVRSMLFWIVRVRTCLRNIFFVREHLYSKCIDLNQNHPTPTMKTFLRTLDWFWYVLAKKIYN